MVECEECHKKIVAYHKLEDRLLCLHCFLGMITNKDEYADKYNDLEG